MRASGIVTSESESPPSPPFVTVSIGLVCLAVLLIYYGISPVLQQAMIEVGGMHPSKLAQVLEQTAASWWDLSVLTVVTSIFIHANWLHLLGNLAYLWVFGMPVEQRFGPFGLMAVFLLGGALANVIVTLSVPQLDTPIIGASGAVSAVVGAYLGLFPRRRIGMFLPLGLYLQFARVPALLVLGSWFTLQLLYTVFGPINAAVAWWTHVTGFALGLSITLMSKALAQIRL
ncbi:MAG: rhomboid family intramembrane serine protease [Xanthomonadales bacterium]